MFKLKVCLGALAFQPNKSEGYIITNLLITGDGGWSAWTNSTGCCSVTCGNGTLTQTRTCTNPVPESGVACTGDAQRPIPCNSNSCSVNGNWSPWTNSSLCTLTCGGGTLSRTRTCTNPSPANGGAACTGDAEQLVNCNNNDCPVNGNWAAWTNSTPCTVTCGSGTLTQTCTCTNPLPTNGGAACIGHAERPITCNDNICPISGNWAAWTNRSPRTLPCGGGTLNQIRTCTNPAPAPGGSACIYHLMSQSELVMPSVFLLAIV